MKLSRWKGSNKKIGVYKLKHGGVKMSRGLNLNKLKNKPNKIVSSEEALKDVTPFKWSEDVIEGKKTIIVSGKCK